MPIIFAYRFWSDKRVNHLRRTYISEQFKEAQTLVTSVDGLLVNGFTFNKVNNGFHLNAY
jgi:hypothetical protein